MAIYLDTSVLVSVYVPESHSSRILKLLQQSKTRPHLSRLTETEFFSTLAAKKRTKELSPSEFNAITELFQRHIAELQYDQAHITDATFETAIEFLRRSKSNLRTLDALHLACSANIKSTLITADKILAKSATELGVANQLI